MSRARAPIGASLAFRPLGDTGPDLQAFSLGHKIALDAAMQGELKATTAPDLGECSKSFAFHRRHL